MGFHRKPKTEVRPASMAFTVIFDTHYSTSTRWRLVVAVLTGGYRFLKETGDPSDPFYVAPGPIWFDTREEGKAEADRRNEHLGLSAEGAMRIVIASMARPFQEPR